MSKNWDAGWRSPLSRTSGGIQLFLEIRPNVKFFGLKAEIRLKVVCDQLEIRPKIARRRLRRRLIIGYKNFFDLKIKIRISSEIRLFTIFLGCILPDTTLVSLPTYLVVSDTKTFFFSDYYNNFFKFFYHFNDILYTQSNGYVVIPEPYRLL